MIDHWQVIVGLPPISHGQVHDAGDRQVIRQLAACAHDELITPVEVSGNGKTGV